MQNIKSIAIIGASDKRNFAVLTGLATRYQLLLFDNNEKALAEIHQALLQENRYASIEQMPCAVNASWEADIIILSGFCINDSQIVQKIKNVATAKTIIIIENDDEFTKSINYQLSFDIIFPHSKIVEVININADDTPEKEFLLEGHSGAALDTVSHMFEGVGFNTYVSQIN
jgi:hypothetical protein